MLRVLSQIGLLIVSLNCFAAESGNPFNKALPPAPPMPNGLTMPELEEVLPRGFVENKGVFDTIEIVGRSESVAVLRYPMMGSSITATNQGISYRQVTVRDGRQTFIGGRSFKVNLPKGETTVQFVEAKSGKIFWEGDLSTPRVYYSTPNQTDFQYTPPLSAGVGIGQGSNTTSPNQAPNAMSMVPTLK